MNKFEVTFYTSVILADKQGSSQIGFKKTYEKKEGKTNIAGLVIWDLKHLLFIESDSGSYFKTDIVTDFSIKELGEK